jgi:chemotaxis protein CheZ
MAPDTRGRKSAAAAQASPGLEARIVALRDGQGGAVPVAEVAGIVRALVDDLMGDPAAEEARLYHEVEKLGRYIRAAKAEIAALNPTDIREDFLPTAADELDAILQATEKATGEIMDATELVEEVAEALTADGPDPARAGHSLRDATTRIYEACSFQDITGQRVTKVVRMLKSIETRVDALVRAFDPDGQAAAANGPGSALGSALGSAGGASQAAGNFGRRTAAAAGDAATDAALLNGPQAETEAMKQDDIDALLASFD